MLGTVQKNFEGYTKRQAKRAILASEAQAMVAHPPDEKFKQMVNHENLRNYIIKAEDITNDQTFFLSQSFQIKGRAVRHKPVWVDPEYTVVPRDFYELHHSVILTADVMFVNRIPLLVN